MTLSPEAAVTMPRESATDPEAPAARPESAVDSSTAAPPMVHPTVRWERWAIVTALGVYFVFQFNAILHHGTWGQDFGSHLRFTARAYLSGWGFLTTYIEGQNNPPLFHFLCAAVYRLTNHIHSLEVISIIATLLNAGALLLLHRMSLRMIESPVMRVAAFVFLTFLPAGMIHAVVLAADCVATPSTVALMYLLMRLSEAGDRRRLRPFVGWGVLAMLALAFAVSVKFTSISLVPAAAAVIILMWFARATSLWRTALGLLIVVAVPMVLGVVTYKQYKKFQKGNLGVSMAMDPFAESTELNVRSLFFVRPADVKLLKAPPYDTPTDEWAYGAHRTLELAVPSRYSYIGLLHLAVFTDVLNIYQYDPFDTYFGRRSHNSQVRMALAVKTAIPFTVAALVSVPWMLGWSMYRVFLRRDRAALPVLTVLTVSFAFFLVIFIFLPFTGALGGGYYLPRLIIPALFGFFLTTFVLLARTVGKTGVGRAICLTAVIVQALVSLSFLWPWGVNGPEAPQLYTLAPSDLGVRAKMDVRFSPLPAGTNEPLVTIGGPGRAYFIWARHDGQGNVKLLYNYWGQTLVPESPPLAADPNRTYHIELDADPRAAGGAGALIVTVDGQEALRVSPWESTPAFRDEIFLFANPSGGGLTSEKFTGTVVAGSYETEGGQRWGRRDPAERRRRRQQQQGQQQPGAK